jgi:sec-independent protein translocase protein TatA
MPSFLGLPELGLLLVILLLLFGPGKLPQVAKSIGESIQQFKKSASGASASKESEPAVTPTATTPEVLPTFNAETNHHTP